MRKNNFIPLIISLFAITFTACDTNAVLDNTTTSTIGGEGLPGRKITITQADYIKLSQCEIDKTANADTKIAEQQSLATVKAMSKSQYNLFLAGKDESVKAAILKYCM